jgi:hypothetical protein
VRGYLNEKIATAVWTTDITVMGTRCADHATPLFLLNLAITLSKSGGQSIGIVPMPTIGHDVFMLYQIIPEGEERGRTKEGKKRKFLLFAVSDNNNGLTHGEVGLGLGLGLGPNTCTRMFVVRVRIEMLHVQEWLVSVRAVGGWGVRGVRGCIAVGAAP